MSSRNVFKRAALGLSALLCLCVASHAQAQYERKNVRYGVSFELPVNSNEAESNAYDLEALNTIYGNFAIKVFPLKDFYGKDKKVMIWVDRYSRNRKMWKSLDSTATLILKQLTVLDNLNPVHSVNANFKKIGKFNAYTIAFEKSTNAGQYVGECIGFIIPGKSLYVKAIHYMPKESFDENAREIQNHFFESIKVK